MQKKGREGKQQTGGGKDGPMFQGIMVGIKTSTGNTFQCYRDRNGTSKRKKLTESKVRLPVDARNCSISDGRKTSFDFWVCVRIS